MTKSELILKLAERNPHLYHRDVERIVTAIFDEITHALARGDRVELRGFGAFSVKSRGSRTGRSVCQETVTSVAASAPNCRCNPATGRAAGSAPMRHSISSSGMAPIPRAKAMLG